MNATPRARTPEAPTLQIGYVEQAMQPMDYHAPFALLGTIEQHAVIIAARMLAQRESAL